MAVNNFIVLSIGSNSCDKETQMANCITWLNTILNSVKTSSIYSTKAINGKDNDYKNAVIIAHCDLDISALTQRLKQYEKNSGRTVSSNAEGVIPIDIDIVMCNGSILREKDFNRNYFQLGWQELNSNL
ncbi:MAG: 2-amino-4-hydroxy-6-hydroxymethyldihydropteridine diphosphokinase [Muribaculaceae bacterium]|nr:2-amino-4-hydroxy-6-hydroxymethyldihydropteridine diphosphokinase [Muribaculaceae bacterium]